MTTMKMSTKIVLNKIKQRDPDQKEFIQAVTEVYDSLLPLFERQPKYLKVFEAIAEPERVIQFRVPWQDDKGVMHINRGFRVQFNLAIGPYKGGLRLHPTVNLSIIKFLGFEQIFKNALTTLPLGGGKGGSDFDPKNKSDSEVLRFCQSFMTELSRHIGPDTDVPAGDIGVGTREVGFMYGQYKRIRNQHSGTFTGKGWGWGGTLIRPQATGYGLVYILECAMADHNVELKGKKICISGSGNVAIHAAEKCIELGARVVTLSDSDGTIHEPESFSQEQLKLIKDIKEKRGRCEEYLNKSKTAKYYKLERPWKVQCDVALPCATQNELNIEQAEMLIANGCKWVFEGSNMSTMSDAIDYLKNYPGVVYFPGKASNAGGVACSGLEMSQNSTRIYWTEKEVDEKLKSIMKQIYRTCKKTAEEMEHQGDFQLGANVAGFQKVADAMLAQGYVI